MTMIIDNLGPIITTFVALSIANERLVETVKKALWFLDEKNTDVNKERWRLFGVYILTLACSFGTVLMSQETVNSLWGNTINFTATWQGITVSAFLISGGSKLWNPILDYFKLVKDAKQGSSTPQSNPGLPGSPTK